MKYQAIAITYQLECLLKKARKESFACIFLSAGCSDSRGDISIMAGFGIAEQFFDLSDVPQCPANPVMGYLGYDYKNQIEPSLKTDQPQLVEFESLKFVIPKAWVAVEKTAVFRVMNRCYWMREPIKIQVTGDHSPLAMYSSRRGIPQWQSQTPKDTYLENVERIKQHIVEGDFYEMNYCIAFTAKEEIDPYDAFMVLSRKAPAPFSVFLKDGDRYLLCASPERFLANGDLIFLSPSKAQGLGYLIRYRQN